MIRVIHTWVSVICDSTHARVTNEYSYIWMIRVIHLSMSFICHRTHVWSTYEYCYISTIHAYTYECLPTLPFNIECLSSRQYSRMIHVWVLLHITIRVYTYRCLSTLPFNFECLSLWQYSRMIHVTHIWMSFIATVLTNDARHTRMNVFHRDSTHEWCTSHTYVTVLMNDPRMSTVTYAWFASTHLNVVRLCLSSLNVFHRDSIHEWCTSHTYECLSSWQYSWMIHVTHIWMCSYR